MGIGPNDRIYRPGPVGTAWWRREGMNLIATFPPDEFRDLRWPPIPKGSLAYRCLDNELPSRVALESMKPDDVLQIAILASEALNIRLRM